MATIDDEFKEVVRAMRAGDDLAEQMEHAARTVASAGSVVSAITSVRAVAPGRMDAIRALATSIAEEYGLDVTVDSTTMCHIRFSRPHMDRA